VELKRINPSDVIWKKMSLHHMDEEGNEYESDTQGVEGFVDDISIGHYLCGNEENEVCCVICIDEEDGGHIFINRTYVIEDMSTLTDKFCRTKIINAYNRFIDEQLKIKSIFD
jgi:hypothetical protein